ncbi:MAG: efflux RND transporter periplasmic adaptor subunit [Ferrovibrio sp.]
MNRGRKLTIAVASALLLAAAGAWYAFTGSRDAPQMRTAAVETGALQATVSAAGTLAAVVTVQVGSQVSGQIRELLADFNSEVKAGQLIARIDPDSFEARVAQAAAELEVARAAVLIQQANLSRARADTDKASVGAVDAQRDFNRKRELAERGVASVADKDKQEANVLGAKAQLQGAQAGTTMAQAQLANAIATVKQREAALRQAQIDLDRTRIIAPVDGVVILRNVDAGQTVAASLQAPVLFTIAQDLRQMQVETSIDEADIGRLREGMPAIFTVDAMPTREFDGTIRQIRKSPQVVQNVVTYTVVISADNRDLRLLPGMTANVKIVTDRRDHALKVPNAALRFRPPAGMKIDNAAGAPAPAAQGEGGGAQFRERLIRWLQLDAAQTASLDRILQDARQKIVGLGSTEMDGRQRSQAIERIRAESRASIADILRPDQREKYVSAVEQRSGGSEGRVVVLRGNMPTSVSVRVGITDGNTSEIVSGGLKEGDQVVLSATMPPPGSLTRLRL